MVAFAAFAARAFCRAASWAALGEVRRIEGDVAARLAAERLLAGEDRVSLGAGSRDAVRLADRDASAAGCGEKRCYQSSTATSHSVTH